MNDNIQDAKRVAKVIGWIVGLIVVLCLVFGSFGTISTGDVGIKSTLGKVTGIIEPGLYLKMPFFQSVDTMDIQTQKEQTDATAASNDLQNVNATVAINYNISPSSALRLYSEIGTDYKARIIDPAVQEVVKATTAQYTAEQLITRRAEVTDKIQKALSDRLASNNINITSVSIINFSFSKNFEAAIEAKVTTEQNALAAKNKLDQVKYEADQAIAKAKGDAESIRIQSQAINSQGGADYVQLQAIKAWDGHLPAQMVPGSAVPFINITK